MSDALSVADVRKSLGKAFNRAHYAKEVIWVAKHGDPFVAVVSDDDGNNILEIRELAQMLEMDPGRLLARLRKLVTEQNDLRDQVVERLSGEDEGGAGEAGEGDAAESPTREPESANG